MKCVIIAAGKGSRLQNEGISKPLMPLLGIPLLERVIQEAAQAGIHEFCVITGYQGQVVTAFLTDVSRRTGIMITTLENPAWEKTQNGISVLQAQPFVKDEPFVMLMCDHLFDSSTIKKLLAEPVKAGEVKLLVDRRLNNVLIDLNDVIKVKEEAGKIINIGKELSDYNAFDTGIFYCSPQCFDAFETSQQQGKTSLTDAIALLAKQGKVRTLDIGSQPTLLHD